MAMVKNEEKDASPTTNLTSFAHLSGNHISGTVTLGIDLYLLPAIVCSRQNESLSLLANSYPPSLYSRDADLDQISARRKPSVQTQKKQANSLLNSLNAMDPKVKGGKERRTSFSSLTPKNSGKNLKDQYENRPASPERKVLPEAPPTAIPGPAGCCVIS